MPVCRIYKLFLPLLLCCLYLQGYAQQRQGVVLHMADSVPEVRNEELKDVTIEIANNSETPFNGILHLYCGKGARIATKQDVAVSLEPGKHLFVSAKVYVAAGTLAGTIPYSAQLFDLNRTRISEATASLKLSGSRLMRAVLTETEIIMPPPGQKINIPVQVINKGNVPQEVNIVIAYPTDLHDQTNKSIRVTVPPFHDTLLYFSRKVTRSMISLENLDVSMYGIYTSGDYFSMGTVSVQRIKSRKTFGQKTLNAYVDHASNLITIGTQNAFSANQSFYLQTKGEYLVDKTNVAFSLNVYKWKNSAMPTLINDTWLSFEYANAGIRVGNIIQTGELSYNGRGVQAYYYTDSLRKTKVFAGYLDKSFNLFNQKNGSASFGNAAWAGFTREAGKVRSNTMLSFDKDKYAGTNSVLVVNDATWRVTDLLFAAAKVGLANSSASNESKEQHQSLSVGGSLSGNLTDALAISSDNLYASGYYPGTRRGTLALNERIGLRLGKTTLSAGYMYNKLNPEYFANSAALFRSNNKGTTAEISAARAIGQLSLSLAAQYYHEEGNWFNNGTVLPGSTDAFRLNTGISFIDKSNRQNILFKADIGKYRASVLPGEHWQFRTNFSYTFLFFRVTGNIQKGNFYLSEVFQQQSGARNDLRMNIAPAVSKSFFNHTLKIDAGLTFYKDLYTNSILYNTSVDCKLGSTHLMGMLQYNTFASSASYRNIQLSLTQLLPQSGKETAHNKSAIELFVFYDSNSNNKYDQGDSAASGYIASFDKTLLLTDRNGKLSYGKLPAGNYKVYFPTQKGWYGADQLIVLQEKEKIRLDIPLMQTGTLSGNIVYEFDEVLSYATATDLAGQSVSATNTEGKTFETRTDDNGRYVLYVPAGVYTITVSNMPAQIEVLPNGSYKQPVTISPGQIIGDIDFKLKVKQRKIDVKKFGAH